jgi:DNA-binding NarL/FixJ family response regulator
MHRQTFMPMSSTLDAPRLSALSNREREVLALMARGRSNRGIARDLLVSPGAVEKHVANIFTKLDLPRSPGLHRRVLAVVAYLGTDATMTPERA